MADSSVYIGIDTTAGQRQATVAALNSRLELLALQDLPMREVPDMVAQYPRAVCGIDAPSQPNPGLLTQAEVRQRVGLDPKKQSYAGYRISEYELRRRGIAIYSSPAADGRVAKWVREGWELYEALRGQGYQLYPATGERIMAEVYPHACFTALIGRKPLPKNHLTGRIQRQLVLYELGLNIPDAMDTIMREWTRHQIIKGEISEKGLHSHDQLDALMAAFTVYRLQRDPQRISAVGDGMDGYIIVPTASLREHYS